MDLLWVHIVGRLIGWLSGNLFGRDVPSGVLGNIIVGFIGSANWQIDKLVQTRYLLTCCMIFHDRVDLP